VTFARGLGNCRQELMNPFDEYFADFVNNLCIAWKAGIPVCS